MNQVFATWTSKPATAMHAATLVTMMTATTLGDTA
jgi:hypothetical protein